MRVTRSSVLQFFGMLLHIALIVLFASTLGIVIHDYIRWNEYPWYLFVYIVAGLVFGLSVVVYSFERRF